MFQVSICSTRRFLLQSKMLTNLIDTPQEQIYMLQYNQLNYLSYLYSQMEVCRDIQRNARRKDMNEQKRDKELAK